jgi:vesicle-associated membrane protein 7
MSVAKCTTMSLSMFFSSHATGRIPFAFLEDIHGRFVKTYGRAALTALAYAMNDEFSRVLSQQMDYYSNDPSADRINRMRGEINQVMHPFFSCFIYEDYPMWKNLYILKTNIGCML